LPGLSKGNLTMGWGKASKRPVPGWTWGDGLDCALPRPESLKINKIGYEERFKSVKEK